MNENARKDSPEFFMPEHPNIVYFDTAPTFGMLGGTIQIELATRHIMPGNDGIRSVFLMNSGLRCSPAAALDLRNALDAALAMLSPKPESVVDGTNTIN